MITFLFTMGAQGWVPLPLCFPATARFIEAVGLSLEIFIFVGIFFTIATSSLLVPASLELLATSFSSTDFLLVAAGSLLKFPSKAFMPTSSLLLSFATSLFLRTRSAAFAAPNLSDPSAACALMSALSCALS